MLSIHLRQKGEIGRLRFTLEEKCMAKSWPIRDTRARIQDAYRRDGEMHLGEKFVGAASTFNECNGFAPLKRYGLIKKVVSPTRTRGTRGTRRGNPSRFLRYGRPRPRAILLRPGSSRAD